MNITFRQLRVFLEVNSLSSYTQAAERLFMTQPAVSMQIKKLEQLVGLPLFEKREKKIVLTEAGTVMHQYAQSITQNLEEMSAAMEELKGVERGSLAISVASTVNYLAPKLLAAFNRDYPKIAISLDVTNRERLLAQLDANKKDLVLMGKPPSDRELLAEPFMANPLVIIAPVQHPLLKRAQVKLNELEQETFVVREDGSGTRIAMERHFNELGAEFHAGMEMTSNEAIKQAVQAGLGLGIVSIHTLEMELETKRLALLNVESFPIQRQWYVVHRQGKHLSPAALAFKKFVIEQSKKMAN